MNPQPPVPDDFAQARGRARVEFPLSLAFPDPKSLWGRSLRIVWYCVGFLPFKVRSGFSFSFFRGIFDLPGPWGPSQRHRWTSVFSGILGAWGPAELTQTLTSGLQPMAIRVRLRSKSSASYVLFLSHQNQPCAYARRIIHTRQGRAKHDISCGFRRASRS
jgi:hypothetical protein